jgi:hypothetical protein
MGGASVIEQVLELIFYLFKEIICLFLGIFIE